MLATVLATLPSKLTKSKILDLLFNLEGTITGTVVSIYLVFGYQAVMLCMAMYASLVTFEGHQWCLTMPLLMFLHLLEPSIALSSTPVFFPYFKGFGVPVLVNPRLSTL